MKGLVVAVTFLSLVLVWHPDVCRAEDFNIARWSHMADIHADKLVGKGVVELTLTPEIFDLARRDLRDLRVVANRSEDMGFTYKTPRPHSYKVPLNARLYNRSNVPNERSSVTVNFGHKLMKNRIEIFTEGENFRRKVLIEGSDDEKNWTVIRDNAYLFRIPGKKEGKAAYDHRVVDFPDNNHQYLKITIFNGEDDPRSVQIKDVKAWKQVVDAPKTEPVPIVESQTKQKKKTTEITLDFGYKNMPLYELKLALEGDNFFRDIEILGRNQETRVVKRVVEDSPALERKVEVPWKTITKSSVWRFTTENSTEESRPNKIEGAKFRYFLIRIFNKDDPPLRFTGATVTRLLTHVTFAPKKKGQYSLYFGNLKASKPDYDLNRYVGKLRRQGVIHAKLGKVLNNPEFNATARQIPWSEQHKALLWIALIGMVVALSVLVFRMAVFARREASQ